MGNALGVDDAPEIRNHVGIAETARSMWRRLLLRATIKGCGIVVVTVDEIDGAVRLLRESNVADEWPGRKLTFHNGLEAPAFQLGGGCCLES